MAPGHAVHDRGACGTTSWRAAAARTRRSRCTWRATPSRTRRASPGACSRPWPTARTVVRARAPRARRGQAARAPAARGRGRRRRRCRPSRGVLGAARRSRERAERQARRVTTRPTDQPRRAAGRAELPRRSGRVSAPRCRRCAPRSRRATTSSATTASCRSAGEQLVAGEYELRSHAREGFEAQTDGSLVVAIDTRISEELRARGHRARRRAFPPERAQGARLRRLRSHRRALRRRPARQPRCWVRTASGSRTRFWPSASRRTAPAASIASPRAAPRSRSPSSARERAAARRGLRLRRAADRLRGALGGGRAARRRAPRRGLATRVARADGGRLGRPHGALHRGLGRAARDGCAGHSARGLRGLSRRARRARRGADARRALGRVRDRRAPADRRGLQHGGGDRPGDAGRERPAGRVRTRLHAGPGAHARSPRPTSISPPARRSASRRRRQWRSRTPRPARRRRGRPGCS